MPRGTLLLLTLVVTGHESAGLRTGHPSRTWDRAQHGLVAKERGRSREQGTMRLLVIDQTGVLWVSHLISLGIRIAVMQYTHPIVTLTAALITRMWQVSQIEASVLQLMLGTNPLC